jgi:hypothetical protein
MPTAALVGLIRLTVGATFTSPDDDHETVRLAQSEKTKNNCGVDQLRNCSFMQGGQCAPPTHR